MGVWLHGRRGIWLAIHRRSQPNRHHIVNFLPKAIRDVAGMFRLSDWGRVLRGFFPPLPLTRG